MYRGCPAGTHLRATESWMTLWQSANPVRAFGVCAPVASSSPSIVFCELLLRKVVSHREAVSHKPLCTDCVRWDVGLLTCFCASQ